MHIKNSVFQYPVRKGVTGQGKAFLVFPLVEQLARADFITLFQCYPNGCNGVAELAVTHAQVHHQYVPDQRQWPSGDHERTVDKECRQGWCGHGHRPGDPAMRWFSGSQVIQRPISQPLLDAPGLIARRQGVQLFQ